jgi:hypothetical protein
VSEADAAPGGTQNVAPFIHRLAAELATTGRDATPAELAAIREHVAQAGFDPTALERARRTAAGAVWKGQVVRPGDFLAPAVAHYLRHVVVEPQWPRGTSLDDYVRAAAAVVVSPESGVIVSYYQGTLQIGFVGRSGSNRGPAGHGWILVEYRLATGHWTTAFQLERESLTDPRRTGTRWLRLPS